MNNYFIDIGFCCKLETFQEEGVVEKRFNEVKALLEQHYPGSTCELVDHGELSQDDPKETQ